MTNVRIYALLLCMVMVAGGMLAALGAAESSLATGSLPPASSPTRMVINSESDFSQAVLSGQCTGTGHADDPYVIEDRSFTWTSPGAAVKVANVTSYFIVRDMVLNGDIAGDMMLYSYGIQVFNASHGVIEHCTVSGFNKNIYIGTGGSLGASSEITVSDCNIAGPGTNEWNIGLELSYVSEVEVHDNNITGCYNGIYMAESHDCICYDNNISYNQGPGIWMGSSCHDNRVVANLIACNGYGSNLISVEGSNNLLYGNAFITSSPNNQVSIGLMMSSNRWNSSGGVGNYWGNQYSAALGTNGSFSGTSVDWNGQTLQVHAVNANNIDHHPFRYMIEPPVIDDMTVGASGVTISWSSPAHTIGPAISAYVIVRSDGATYEVPADQLTFTNTLGGEWRSYNYTVMAKNAWGCSGGSTSPLAQNPARPSIEITSSLHDGWTGALGPRNIVVAWTGYDSDSALSGKGLSHYWVTLDNGTWTDVGTSTSHVFDKVVQGSHAVQVRGEDADGNSVTAERYFLVYQALDISMELSSIKSSLGSDITADILVTDYATGDPLPGVTIDLFQSVDGGATYGSSKFSTLTTDSEGRGSTSFIPTATTNYVIQARGQMDYMTPTFYSNVSLTISPYEGRNAFSVQSTSTVTDLTFSSSTKELRFTVSGASGTTGVTKVFIAKSLVNDGTSVNVELDQNDIEYTVVEQGDYWVLTFSYTHSSHAILVGMPTLGATGGAGSAGGVGIEVLIAIGVVGAVAVSAFLLVRSKRKS